MDLDIRDKIAMVAASSQGIGFAIAESLAKEDVIDSICSRNEENIRKALAKLGPKHRGYVCDLQSSEDIKKWIHSTYSDLGSPSILVTNTGGPATGSVDKTTIEEWNLGFNSILLSSVRLVDGVCPYMKENKWGRIVHITSSVAKDPSSILPISSVFRAGMSAMCRLQAKSYGEFGITVNCLLPGRTATERSNQIISAKATATGVTFDEEKTRTAKEIPLKRLATPREIGDVAAFLCSERASFMNGSIVVVDGGTSRGLG